MSTFLVLKDHPTMVFDSPKSKQDLVSYVVDFLKKYKKVPERISFTLWDPIDVDFLTSIQTHFNEETMYMTRGDLFVHECIETTFGAHIDLAEGPPLEE